MTKEKMMMSDTKLTADGLDALQARADAVKAAFRNGELAVPADTLLSLIAAARALESATAQLNEWQSWAFALGKPPITDDTSLRAQLQEHLEALALYRCGDIEAVSGAECTRLKGHLSEGHWDGAGHRWGVALLPQAEPAVAARASLESGGAPPARDDQGYQVVWNWEPYARFLGARAQLIKEKRAEGLSWEAIARELSCEPMQVQLIGMSELSGICGIPGAVWPPKEHQKPEPVPSAAGAELLTSPALAAEARASARLDGETHCLPEEPMAGWAALARWCSVDARDRRIGCNEYTTGRWKVWAEWNDDVVDVGSGGTVDAAVAELCAKLAGRHESSRLPSPPKVTP